MGIAKMVPTISSTKPDHCPIFMRTIPATTIAEQMNNCYHLFARTKYRRIGEINPECMGSQPD